MLFQPLIVVRSSVCVTSICQNNITSVMPVCVHQLILLSLILFVLLTRSDVSPLREPELSVSHSCELTSLISEFEEIFSEQPGKTHLVQHHIKLSPSAAPSRSAPYHLSPDKMNFVKEEIATLKEEGIVWHGSPCHKDIIS